MPLSAHLHLPESSLDVAAHLLLKALACRRQPQNPILVSVHGHSAGSYTGAWIAAHVNRTEGLHLQVAQLSGLNFPAQVLEPLLKAKVHLLHLTGDKLSR